MRNLVLQQTSRVFVTVASRGGQGAVVPVPLAVARVVLFLICSHTLRTLIVFGSDVLWQVDMMLIALRTRGARWKDRNRTRLAIVQIVVAVAVFMAAPPKGVGMRI